MQLAKCDIMVGFPISSHVRVCVCVCVCKYISVSICLCVHALVYTHVCVYICMDVYTYNKLCIAYQFWFIIGVIFQNILIGKFVYNNQRFV